MAISDILEKFEKAQETAAAANQRRYEQALAIYDEIINRYGPGGTFMAGAEAELERQKERDVAAEIAHSISAGMYGTTRPGTAGRRWEAEVGAPSRLKLEDIRMERLSQAQVGKAGAIERVEDAYPDYALMAGLMSQAAAGGGGGGSYSRGGELFPLGRFGETQFPRRVSGGGYTTGGYTGGYTGGGYTGTPTTRPRRAKSTSTEYQPAPPVFTPEGGVGLYLGEGRMLSPEQVEWTDKSLEKPVGVEAGLGPKDWQEKVSKGVPVQPMKRGSPNLVIVNGAAYYVTEDGRHYPARVY